MGQPGVEEASPVASVPLPRSFGAGVALLWSQVLFPGKVAASPSLRISAVLLLLFLPGVLLYPCLSFHLFEPDESRYAEIPREMLMRGEGVVPYLQGEPYLDKPPLFYWLVMGSYRLLGVHDWAARLIPALALHGCILLVYLLGRRSVGERAAFWGAMALGLAPGFMGMGRLLLLDGLLAFWVTLALLSAFEAVRGDSLRKGWWLLAALACGLAILTKGPVAMLLLLPPLWMHRWLTGSPTRISWRAYGGFFAVILLVALPWYVAFCVRMPHFAVYFLWEHNVVRFLSPFDHQQPMWFYGPVLALGLLPGTLLALPFLRFLFSGDAAVAQRRTPELGFLLLAGGWCVLFFTLSGCKLPTYVLPAFPPLTLALGCYLAGSSWAGSRGLKGGVVATFAMLCLAHHVVVPWYAWYRSPMGRPAEVAARCDDPETPVVCYPRNCDSVAYYLGRDNFVTYRSKQIDLLRLALMKQPRTVVLLTHRHSLQAFRQALPSNLRVVHVAHFGLVDVPGLPDWMTKKVTLLAGETALGLCDLAVVERMTP